MNRFGLLVRIILRMLTVIGMPRAKGKEIRMLERFS
jgi:hypothetical protein